MYFEIDPKKSIPLYEQVIQQVKELCARGLLKPNEKLPSVRDLSSQMLINPNTVSKAYQELERQGIIITIRGRGTFISEELTGYIDPKKTERLQQALKNVIIDSHFAGISEIELKRWTEEIYKKLGGNGDEG
ncbi:GntR family transcriptional regulator [Salipaludibacillus neizhouensis]|uniref:GntR family transcriptional regulator n=1 Tax=Salipaludibacillus neizhouensis TaxID=885475 RepID=A0A3A9KL01_9BACI|nr:GntR family transcriptional regulator [Salipaludibacillus neizhouensis]RKL68495.1 GntR family transcriptional regulator [Salipaludibacillus neizhouensis]